MLDQLISIFEHLLLQRCFSSFRFLLRWRKIVQKLLFLLLFLILSHAQCLLVSLQSQLHAVFHRCPIQLSYVINRFVTAIYHRIRRRKSLLERHGLVGCSHLWFNLLAILSFLFDLCIPSLFQSLGYPQPAIKHLLLARERKDFDVIFLQILKGSAFLPALLTLKANITFICIVKVLSFSHNYAFFLFSSHLETLFDLRQDFLIFFQHFFFLNGFTLFGCQLHGVICVCDAINFRLYISSRCWVSWKYYSAAELLFSRETCCYESRQSSKWCSLDPLLEFS